MTSKLHQNQANDSWTSARTIVVKEAQKALTGKSWLQLASSSDTLLTTPDSISLSLAQASKTPNPSTGRLSALPEGCADVIICDYSFQQHPRPDIFADEVQHLLKPGGQILLIGAGSLRGRLAAEVATDAASLKTLIQLFDPEHYALQQCHIHGSQPPARQWRQQMQLTQMRCITACIQRWPSSAGAFLSWANTRPGWVVLLQDQRNQPIAKPLKSPIAASVKLKPITSVLARQTNHQKTDEKPQPKTYA